MQEHLAWSWRGFLKKAILDRLKRRRSSETEKNNKNGVRTGVEQ